MSTWFHRIRLLSNRLLRPTLKNLAGYMSLTYSITGLLVILGLAGQHAIAADVAVIQGATLATFYVLSGDARHLILSGQIKAEQAIFFRLVWVLPLAVLSYLMSVLVSDQLDQIVTVGLILRRSAEWLAEVHVTEIERREEVWSGWLMQPFLLVAVIAQMTLAGQTSLIWLWAVSPLFFSGRFLLTAQAYSFLKLGWENFASTAIIGFTGYIQRLLIVSLAGKELAGMLFPGFAIGSFIGTMAANVAGPTAVRKGWLQSHVFSILLVIWSLVGLVVYWQSGTILYQTVGLSIIGGAVMIAAQHARLILLTGSHTLELDLLFHLMLIVSIPLEFGLRGYIGLENFYLVGAVLAWTFYKGGSVMHKLGGETKNILFSMILIGLVSPIFVQIGHGIYNDFSVAMLDSGGSLAMVPLPLSLAACFIGILIFQAPYQQTKPIVVTIAAFFFALIISTALTREGMSKPVLLLQYILPTIALLLGVSMANFNSRKTSLLILYFLIIFVPFQLVATWLQGQLALTHYLYFFSVYQHYQYVPLIIVGLYVWVWIDLNETHWKWIYGLAPLMGMYVAAGNSTLALFGLVGFAVFFAWRVRQGAYRLFVPLLVVFSVGGYFYLNAQLADSIKIKDEIHGITRHGIFVDKFFDKHGHWLYSEQSKLEQSKLEQKSTELPINVVDRGKFAKVYLDGMLQNPEGLLIGHSKPPSREIASSAHNYYIDLIYNFGVLACLPILFLLGYTVRCYYRIAKVKPLLVWPLLVVVYFVVVDSNLKVTLRQPYPGIIIFFLWGILLRQLQLAANHLNEKTNFG